VKQIHSRWPAWVACLFFFLSGRAFIPHLGLQNDEALFGGAFFEPKGAIFSQTFPQLRFPLMLMSYLGTCKAWMYRQIFRAVRPSLSSIRVPMLLAGVATIWLFDKLLRRIAGARAAVLGTSLLAADSIFLLTDSFDWGPVALQHLLVVGGLCLVLRFYHEQNHFALAGSFFLFGLGMWDKALMIWMLSGMGLAALLTFPRQVFASITLKRIGIAVLAFALGALPLIVYNVESQWATFRGNTSFDFGDIPGKARLLAGSLTGDALFGWMVAEDHEPPKPHPPASALERAANRISEAAGHPRRNLMIFALAAALLLAPLANSGERRAIVFAVTAMAVAWGQMAITRNAGGSVHHAVLIWPLPHMVVAISLAAASRRLGRVGKPALVAVGVLLVGSNFLVMNQYYVQTMRNGGSLNWNDSIVTLADYMKDSPSSNVFCVDWGIVDSLRLLSRGRIPVRVGSDPVSKPELTAEDREIVRSWLKEPDHWFIAHTEGNEFFPGVNAKLVKLAGEMGYEREMLRIVGDRFGRNMFEVYHFRPAVAK
jgi:hypothetical protein